MTIYLYNIGQVMSLKDLSPFCMKLETYLKMTHIPYQSLRGDPRIAPKGKFPYIQHHGHYLGDSSLIIDYLKEHYGDALDHDLKEQECHQAIAFKNMIEEHLYFVEIFFRWQQTAGYRILKPVLTQLIKENMQAPAFMAPIIRFNIRRQLKNACYYHGIGRHQAGEVATMGKSMVKAINGFLADKPFFLGDRPHSIDASVFAFIESLLHCPVPSPVADYTRHLNPLVDYCQRMNHTYFKNADKNFTQPITTTAFKHHIHPMPQQLMH